MLLLDINFHLRKENTMKGNDMREERSIVAYIGTIWDDIQGLDEDSIRELVLSDIALMDEETASYTMGILDDIVKEAVREIAE